jgi:hypothetical protein
VRPVESQRWSGVGLNVSWKDWVGSSFPPGYVFLVFGDWVDDNASLNQLFAKRRRNWEEGLAGNVKLGLTAF